AFRIINRDLLIAERDDRHEGRPNGPGLHDLDVGCLMAAHGTSRTGRACNDKRREADDGVANEPPHDRIPRLRAKRTIPTNRTKICHAGVQFLLKLLPPSARANGAKIWFQYRLYIAAVFGIVNGGSPDGLWVSKSPAGGTRRRRAKIHRFCRGERMKPGQIPY